MSNLRSRRLDRPISILLLLQIREYGMVGLEGLSRGSVNQKGLMIDYTDDAGVGLIEVLVTRALSPNWSHLAEQTLNVLRNLSCGSLEQRRRLVLGGVVTLFRNPAVVTNPKYAAPVLKNLDRELLSPTSTTEPVITSLFVDDYHHPTKI